MSKRRSVKGNPVPICNEQSYKYVYLAATSPVPAHNVVMMTWADEIMSDKGLGFDERYTIRGRRADRRAKVGT